MNGDQPTGYPLWFTGLPCSGKTTLAQSVGRELAKIGYPVEYIDGDLIRKNLTKDLGFSKEDRETNIGRAAFVASLLTKHGVMTLVSLVSPYRSMRENAKNLIGRFIEIHVSCPIEVCEKRDTKGMYKLACEGKIRNFTGVSDPFEEPSAPDLLVHSDKNSIGECTRQVIDYLVGKGIVIPPDPFPGNKFLTQVYRFAARAHRGQTRKGKNLPYIVHPLSVAKKLESLKYPEHVIAAGLLHDALEDTGCEIEEIEKVAGKKAAKIVSEVTDPDKTVPWRRRKADYLAKLKKASKEALAVSCADKIDNIESIIENVRQSGKKFTDQFSTGMKQKTQNYALIYKTIRARDPRCRLLDLYREKLDKLGTLFQTIH